MARGGKPVPESVQSSRRWQLSGEFGIVLWNPGAESFMFCRLACCLCLIGVLKAEAGEGMVRTLAGNGTEVRVGNGGPGIEAGVGNPFGVVIGPDGALYICEVSNHCIRRLDLQTGLITTVAGTGQKGYSGDGGPAVQAQLNEPYEIRFSRNHDMYFVEMQNAVIRKVAAETGIISTVAGTGKSGFSGDGGPARMAQFKRPHSIIFDAQENLYVCDIGNHRIRRIDRQTGLISTFAGTGARQPTPDGASITGTPLNGPRALDFDRASNSLILALREGNALYRIDLGSQTVHHLAGTGEKGYSATAPAKTAQLSGPKGVAVGPDGDIYFADTESHTVRVYRQKAQVVETVIGDGQRGDGPDGPAWKCRLARPHGVFVDRLGNLYVGDSENHRVRLFESAATASTSP